MNTETLDTITSRQDLQDLRSKLADIDAQLEAIRQADGVKALIHKDILISRWAKIRTAYDQLLRAAIEEAQS